MADTPAKLECTVTFLEMRARPTDPGPLMPAAKLTLLRAEQPSVAFYRFLYETVGTPWLWHERGRLGDDELAEIISDPEVEVYVLYAAGVPAGFSELDLRKMPDIELAYFGLMPDFIGRGLGRYLLRWSIDQAWTHTPKRLRVNTCNLDHPRALGLYQRAGFVAYKQETTLIDDPGDIRAVREPPAE